MDNPTGLVEISQRGVWIIANPAAGGRQRRKRLNEAIALLKSRLPVADVRWTERRGDAERWAREAVEKRVGLLIAYGGDGTINEIANGLAGSDVAIGMLPCGTANVVACELGIPFDPVEAATSILSGRIVRVHLGHAEYAALASGVNETALAGERTARHFLFAAGVGFDAYVCRQINPRFKRWAGKGAYVVDGWRIFFGYRSPRLHVALDGDAPITCSELVVANARSYGGRFSMAPDASLYKSDLDACLFLNPGRWNLLRYTWGIVRGKHVTYADVICRKVQSVEVAAENPVYLELDGDAVGTVPARFTVRQNALSFVVH